MTDNIFLLTLGFIFLTALAGIYLRRRRRDRCLKDFEAFRVTIELNDGKLIWGRLAVFSNGLELFYPEPKLDASGHQEVSYVFFQAHVDQIQAIYRYHDELSQMHQEERLAEIERTYKPGVYRRAMRMSRNFLNTFGDAFNQSIGAALAQAKKTGQATAIKGQEKHITKIGTEVLGAAGNAFEPILERYIGRKVVIEEKRGDVWVEHSGILKEYTDKWIELLDSRTPEEVTFDLSAAERLKINRDIDFVVRKAEAAGFDVSIENHGDENIELKRIEATDYTQEIGALIAPGQTVHHTIESLPPAAYGELAPDAMPDEVVLRAEARGREIAVTPDERPPLLPSIRLIVHTIREVDRLLPRRHSVLRHGGEPIERWYESLRRRKLGG